jgi:hypothetical protein
MVAPGSFFGLKLFFCEELVKMRMMVYGLWFKVDGFRNRRAIAIGSMGLCSMFIRANQVTGLVGCIPCTMKNYGCDNKAMAVIGNDDLNVLRLVR